MRQTDGDQGISCSITCSHYQSVQPTPDCTLILPSLNQSESRKVLFSNWNIINNPDASPDTRPSACKMHNMRSFMYYYDYNCNVLLLMMLIHCIPDYQYQYIWLDQKAGGDRDVNMLNSDNKRGMKAPPLPSTTKKRMTSFLANFVEVLDWAELRTDW